MRRCFLLAVVCDMLFAVRCVMFAVCCGRVSFAFCFFFRCRLLIVGCLSLSVFVVRCALFVLCCWLVVALWFLVDIYCLWFGV